MAGGLRSRGAVMVIGCLLLALLWLAPSAHVRADTTYTVNSAADPASGTAANCPFATADTWSVTATDGSLSSTRTVAVPLVVAGVSPTSGDVRGGGTVAITGAHFGTGPAGMSITFGNAAASSPEVTKNTIMVTVPAHAAGAVDVAVVVNGQQATLRNGYTYGTVQILPDRQPASGSGSPAPLPATRPSGNPAGTPNALPLPRP